MKTLLKTFECNFDGLVGPTHNYAGLARGNKASMKNRHEISRPREAALQGLKKMKFLMDRGFKQAVLPPPLRPDLRFLRDLGLTGEPKKLLQSAQKISPALLASCYSASGMWTANSATVSPGADTADGKVHFTPANLHSCLHRSLETRQTRRILQAVFPDPRYFVHHPPLPSLPAFADEGAANHNRLCGDLGAPGVEVFVYGHGGFSLRRETEVFSPRQSRAASQTIALRHKLRPEKTVFVQQNPKAVDTGVFHNDVICATDGNLIFYHETAFTDTAGALREIQQKLAPAPLLKIRVREKDISLKEAVSSYLFNSQLLTKGNGKRLLLAPLECEEEGAVKQYLKSLPKDLIQETAFIPVRQSMRNGGGPACLRLRVVLTEEEAGAIHKGVRLNQELYEKLKSWIEKHYRDRLRPEDLLDPLLIKESQTALEELSRLLRLKNIYTDLA